MQHRSNRNGRIRLTTMISSATLVTLLVSGAQAFSWEGPSGKNADDSGAAPNFQLAYYQDDSSAGTAGEPADAYDYGSTTTTTTTTTEVETVPSMKSYLLSDENVFGDAEVLWPGFLTGMRSNPDFAFTERFVDPIGNPLYFESPFIESNLDVLYLWHDFPGGSQLQGGQVHVLALQARLALTDRLAFIATKDGYSWIDTGITPESSGWNDIGIGLKYALIVDPDNEFVLTTGSRWEWVNGDRGTLQSGTQELSPFISVAKGLGPINFLGNVTYRIPMDSNDGNHILQWDLHADFELDPENMPGLFPVLEIHGLHYLSDGDALPLSAGGLDYTNLGSSNVGGTFVSWGDIGFRYELTPNVSLGAGYGFPITNPHDDIFNQRVTVRLTFSY